jgi:hypothetical protein
LLEPFFAAYYSQKNRNQISSLVVTDLDSAEHLWGGADHSRSFRHVLVGAPERRGETWQAWISTGEVDLADESMFYVLRQSCEVEGIKIDRWALYCALDIHDQKLFIHEDVIPEGVERARQSTEACESDLAPIFVGCDEGLARDFRALLEEAVLQNVPLLSHQEADGSKHEVWPLLQQSTAMALQAIFQGAPLFLLDGHHRLAAAKENHRLGMGDGKILACICSMGVQDTLILPIHRTIHYSSWMLPDAFLGDLTRAGCRVNELPDLKVNSIAGFLESSNIAEPYFLALHSHGESPSLVYLPNSKTLPPQLAGLSVAGFDFTVMEQFPGATCIPVTKIETALEQLASDQAHAAIFLPPSRASEVRSIALSRLKMPRKSTRFVPKPALGLISRPWMNSGGTL